MHSSRYDGRTEEDRSISMIHWEDPEKRVEISDDEDLNTPSVFQKGGKMAETTPLDLSVFGQDTPTRQVESPLDLSTKTRKRHADSTEHYRIDPNLIRGGNIIRPPFNKRLCLIPGSELGPRGGNNVDPRYISSQESVIKTKYAIPKTVSNTRSPQASPHPNSIAQVPASQALLVQRQVQINHSPGAQVPSQQFKRQRPCDTAISHVGGGASSYLRTADPKQGQVQNSPGRPQGPKLYQPDLQNSESTNLKGFFEQTTQKHVVIKNHIAFPPSSNAGMFQHGQAEMYSSRRPQIQTEQNFTEPRSGQAPFPPGVAQSPAYVGGMHRTAATIRDRHPGKQSMRNPTSNAEYQSYRDLQSAGQDRVPRDHVSHYNQGLGSASVSGAEQRTRFMSNSETMTNPGREVHQNSLVLMSGQISSKIPVYNSQISGPSPNRAGSLERPHSGVVRSHSGQERGERMVGQSPNDKTALDNRHPITNSVMDSRISHEADTRAAIVRLGSSMVPYSRAGLPNELQCDAAKDPVTGNRGQQGIHGKSPMIMENIMSDSSIKRHIETTSISHARNPYGRTATASAVTRGQPDNLDIYKTNARELGLSETRHPYSRQNLHGQSAAISTVSRTVADHPSGLDQKRIVSQHDRLIRMSEMHYVPVDKQSPKVSAVQHSPGQTPQTIMERRRSSFGEHIGQLHSHSLGLTDTQSQRSSQEQAVLSSLHRVVYDQKDRGHENSRFMDRPGRHSSGLTRSLVAQHLFGVVPPRDTSKQQRESNSGNGSRRTAHKDIIESSLQNSIIQRTQPPRSSSSIGQDHLMSNNSFTGGDSGRSQEQSKGVLMKTNSAESVPFKSNDRGSSFDANHNIQDQRRKLESPIAPTHTAGRSIVKGTSGMQRGTTEDLIGEIIIKEWQKENDTDDSENPFANRSILKEIENDQQNSTSVKGQQRSVEQSQIKAAETFSSDSVHRLPLKIAIPGGNKTSTNNTNQPAASNVKQENPSKNPKAWSRKHMILSAVKQDEDLKNIVDIDSVSVKKPTMADANKSMQPPRRTEDKPSAQDSTAVGPASPKMPILSPQEKVTNSPSVPAGSGEPPTLDGPKSSESITENNKEQSEGINNLEKHLHRLISDAVNGQGSFAANQKDLVCESVYRELSHKPFPSRQLSQSKNIPVANVAPIVHGRNPRSEEMESKTGIGHSDRCGNNESLSERTNTQKDLDEKSALELDPNSNYHRKSLDLNDPNMNSLLEQQNSNKHHVVEYVSTSRPVVLKNDGETDHLKDEKYKETLSPGIKRAIFEGRFPSPERGLCLDIKSVKTEESENVENIVRQDSVPHNVVKMEYSTTDTKEQRNVFGTFNKILCTPEQDHGQAPVCDDVTQAGKEREDTMDFSNGYDGDDEGRRCETESTRNRQSVGRQKAEKQTKRARHSKLEEHRHKRLSQKSTDYISCDDNDVASDTDATNKPRRPSWRQRKRDKGDVTDEYCNSDEDDCAFESVLNDKLCSEDDTDDQSQIERSKNGNESCDSKSTKASTKASSLYGNTNESTPLAGSLRGSEEEGETTEYEDIESLEEQFRMQESLKEKKRLAALKKKRTFHFKQKYIFQKKRRGKGRGRGIEKQNRAYLGKDGGPRDQTYDFRDEMGVASVVDCVTSLEDQIPVPAEVRRLAVNKDTGETLLHRAARMGYEEVALYCLATGSVNVSARDNAGYTPLHECAVHGHVIIATHLVRQGADVNCPSSQDGVRPIHDAVENDRIEMVRLLLAYGADPMLATYSGRTPLKLARTDRMRRFLQSYFCDVNGYGSDVEEKPWTFGSSSTLFDWEKSGCAVFNDVPSDPEDETGEICTLSSKPQFPTHRLTDDKGKRTEDYIILDDILQGFRVNLSELDNLDLSPLLIKTIPFETLYNNQKDSVFFERYKMSGGQPLRAVRCVDATQVINKVSKHAVNSPVKRTKI